MRKFLNIVKFFLGWPISILALFFISKLFLSNKNAIFESIGRINLSIFVLSIFSFLAYFIARAYLWQNILKEQGYKIPFKRVAFLWEMSEIKRFVPGSIWSFLGRTAYFSQDAISAKTILKSMAIEIKFLILGSFFVSMFSLFFVLDILGISDSAKPLIVSLVIVLTVLTVIFFVFLKSIAEKILPKNITFIKHFVPSFDPKVNLKLFFIALFFMLFFGLGSFLAASSIFPFSLSQAPSLIGFLVLSFLIGFVLIISPMGLGIREAVTVFGLSKIVTLSNAGFIALSVRIILIFSEIVFLMLVFLRRK